MTRKHTPLLLGNSGLDSDNVYDANGKLFCTEAVDPDFIVRACNSHHDLLEALEDITAGLNHAEDTKPLIKGEEVRKARAAIKKATGEI